jgi:hypothetical protein
MSHWDCSAVVKPVHHRVTAAVMKSSDGARVGCTPGATLDPGSAGKDLEAAPEETWSNCTNMGAALDLPVEYERTGCFHSGADQKW